MNSFKLLNSTLFASVKFNNKCKLGMWSHEMNEYMKFEFRGPIIELQYSIIFIFIYVFSLFQGCLGKRKLF